MNSPLSLHSRRGKLVLAGVLCLLGAGLLFLLRPGSSAPHVPVAAMSLALPTQISAGALFVAADRRIFAEHDLAVKTTMFALGRDALQAVLLGKADLAVLADTPFMFAVMKGEKIATVATLFGSRKTMSVLGRHDRHIERAEDLGGKTIGTMFGTNAQIFLDALLAAHGVPRESVTVLGMAPEALEGALRDGKVDAITSWNPKLGNAFGKLASKIYGEDLFVYRFILVGKQAYIDSHQAEVVRLLAGIEQANRFISTHPVEAMRTVADALNMDQDLLGGYFEPTDFQITLDQSLLLSLGDQTRWAMRQNLVPAGPMPNYLDYVRQAPLDAVRPSANKIIR
jgi:ABC-type nitrate/sulfonate/bicarbonate transport system substrate-binding protein